MTGSTVLDPRSGRDVVALPGRPAQPAGTLGRVLAGRAGLSRVMVGRASALAQLHGAVDAAAVCDGDHPAVVLVWGEAGVGKTRLLRELMAGMPTDTAVLTAQADQATETRSFGLIVDLLGSSLPDGGDPLRGAVEAVAARVASTPTLLIFEDLHWTDAESAGVIDRLALQPWPHVVIVGTYRPEDLTRRTPGGDLVMRLERRHTVERIHLERLARADVSTFLVSALGRQPSSAVIEAIYERSGGNPFVIEELIGCCRDMELEDVVHSKLPWSLEEVVRRQLEGLTAEERSVAEAAAICGPSTPFDVLATVAGLDDTDLLPRLRTLVDRGLLVEERDDRFGFGHALVRDAVAGQLLGRERRRFHERALEALRDRPDADPLALARHALGAGRYDDVVAIAREGAEAYLAQGSTFPALRLADEALAEEPEDQTLLAVATRAAWLVGLLDESLGYAERWRTAAVRRGDLDGESDAVRYVVRLQHEMGAAEPRRVALARLVELVDLLPPGRPRARTLAALAQSAMLVQDGDEAVRWAEQAIVEAEKVGADDLVVQARIERASAEMMIAGSSKRAVADLRSAIADAEQIGDWVLATRGWNNLLEGVPAHTSEGQRIVERMTVASDRAGFDAMSCESSIFRQAALAFGAADLPTTRRRLSQARATTLSDVKVETWGTWFELQLALEEGRIDDARVLAGRLARNGRPDEVWDLALATLQIAARTGDADEGRRAVVSLIEAPPVVDPSRLPSDLVRLVDDALTLATPGDLLREQLVAPRMADAPGADTLAAAVDGLVLKASGQSRAAAVRLADAVVDPDSPLPRFEVGWLRVRQAEALLADGDLDGAREAAGLALDDLSRWPGWRRDRAQALAHRLEAPSAPSDGELTNRESEVAALLAEGLTNGQIAQRLYISPKTAAVHVSNILTKLHLSNRAEIAAWAVRSGLVTSKAG